MIYTEETIQELEDNLSVAQSKHDRLVIRLSSVASELRNDSAKDYIYQGIARRLKLLFRCVKNIYKIYPLDTEDLLTSEELTDLSINLHAFFININGIFDNIAWVFVHENDLLNSSNLSKHDVGLFKKNMRQHLPTSLTQYLESKEIKSWHENYSKAYRDAQAHRIPLYIPPSILYDEDKDKAQEISDKLSSLKPSSLPEIELYGNLQNQLFNIGKPCPFFAHSLKDKGSPVYLHAQVVSDLLTIEELINTFCNQFKGGVIDDLVNFIQ